MKRPRFSSHARWCASLLLSLLLLGAAAHAQVRARPASKLPTTTLSPKATGSLVAPAPSITRARPRSLEIGIGEQPATMTIDGSHLSQVTAIEVINNAGVRQPHIQAHPSAHARSNSSLSFQVYAGKDARPGQYRLQLLIPADPRQVQTRPQNAPLASAAPRIVPVPANQASITVRAMQAAITSIQPPEPARATAVLPRLIVSDVPGSEIISVTRFEGPVQGYCDYHPDPRIQPEPRHRGGVQTSRWLAPHTLQIDFTRGEFHGRSNCQLRFSIRTRNALGEEFASFTSPASLPLRAAPTPTRLPVSSTWALKDYLHLPRGFVKGVCAGNSLGAHGSIPVGIVNVNGKLGFRARSGPIGTECGWTVATNRLEPGWTLHMTFRIRRIGDKCNVTDGSTAQFDFSATRHAQILSNGEVSLSNNLSHNGNALKLIDLRCGATLSNDHEVLVEMTAASVSRVNPLSSCDWKCAFR